MQVKVYNEEDEISESEDEHEVKTSHNKVDKEKSSDSECLDWSEHFQNHLNCCESLPDQFAMLPNYAPFQPVLHLTLVLIKGWMAPPPLPVLVVRRNRKQKRRPKLKPKLVLPMARTGTFAHGSQSLCDKDNISKYILF